MHADNRNLINAGDVAAIAARFNFGGKVAEIMELDLGKVNDTYVIKLASNDTKFILQRINPRVFPQPALIMENLRIVAEHVRRRLAKADLYPPRRWEIVRICATRDGNDYVVDSAGGCWRATSFIDNASSYTSVKDVAHAGEAGRALGLFHRLLSDMDPNTLHDPLPGFHVTPTYLEQYDATLDSLIGLRYSSEIKYCIEFIEARRREVSVLEDAKGERKLVRRIIHGDPKISNIMVDDATGRAVSLIDLDTVKPGLIQYDLGDCLRSCCNEAGEECEDPGKTRFALPLCRAILEGYLEEAAFFLNGRDYDYIYEAVRLIAFELGLRFFTDYLAGDIYFKVSNPEQNLARSIGQFRLTKSIEDQEKPIRQLIVDLRRRYGVS